MTEEIDNAAPLQLPEVVGYPSTYVVQGNAPATKIPVAYSEDLAERISDFYIEGMSLAAICRLPEMPSYPSVMRWAKDKPDFKQKLEAARALRAIHFEEKALSAAEAATGPQDTPAERLRFDAYRWAAEVSDPSTYGKKTTVQGDPKRPIVFNVTTGFPGLPESQCPPELGPDGLVKSKAPEVIETTARAVEEDEAQGE